MHGETVKLVSKTFRIPYIYITHVRVYCVTVYLLGRKIHIFNS